MLLSLDLCFESGSVSSKLTDSESSTVLVNLDVVAVRVDGDLASLLCAAVQRSINLA